MSTLIELQERREILGELIDRSSHMRLSAALPVHLANTLFQSSAMKSFRKDRSC